MTPDDSFDLDAFAEALAKFPAEERASRVDKEVQRVRALTVRDAGKRFNQQMHVTRLERLGRALSGHDVGGELTKSERASHALLLGAPQAVESAPKAATPQAATPKAAKSQAAAPKAATPPASDEAPEPSGAERRVSRRIQMKTRFRIRRDSDSVADVLEPLNVSRGGVGFQSSKRFTLHETVWVTMHYQPGSAGEMETKSIIVRAAPLSNGSDVSYGVKFL